MAIILTIRFLNGLALAKHGNVFVTILSSLFVPVILIPLLTVNKRENAISVIFLFCLIFVTYSENGYGQTNNDSSNRNYLSQNHNIKSMERFEYSFNTANPKAQILMNEGFFWSPIEETAPFGSDDGSDAAYGFHEWRISNNTTDPIVYLKELIARWNYPNFDWTEMDTVKIRSYLEASAVLDESTMRNMKESLKEMSKSAGEEMDDVKIEESIKASMKGMGRTYLLGLDNAIIGTGFAQLAIEGHIDNSLRQLTIIAINRQLLPLLISRYDENYQKIRKNQLTKMLYSVQHSS
jgi:uncharacterized protein YfeS